MPREFTVEHTRVHAPPPPHTKFSAAPRTPSPLQPLPSQITCSEIFGGSDIYPHLHWFLPIKAEFPTEQLPLILGYAVGGGGDVEMGGVEGDGGGGGCEGGECEDTGDVGEESGLLNETGSGSGARSRPVKSDRSVNEDEANIV